MLKPRATKQFKKDYKKAKKQNKNLKKLEDIMAELEAERQMPLKFRDHLLAGKFEGSRECHIEPDWLLIYRIDKPESEIIFERTGTHSDLFK